MACVREDCALISVCVEGTCFMHLLQKRCLETKQRLSTGLQHIKYLIGHHPNERLEGYVRVVCVFSIVCAEDLYKKLFMKHRSADA